MYCGHCGKQIVKENSRFCGNCGAPVVAPVQKPQVVYVEEKPLTPVLEDRTVVALTFCVLLLSILTIVVSSIITQDYDEIRPIEGYDSIIVEDV